MNTNKRKDYFDEYAEKEIESGKLWRGLVANEFYKNFVEQLLIYGNVFVKDGKIVDPKKLILNMKQKKTDEKVFRAWMSIFITRG